jgi:isopentenyl diphosphate isomerase/L-lactate dehydrogenase-like FMN-dependent dehydrogenase
MHTSIDSPTDCSIEEAMATATGPVWFQLYVLKDRGFSSSLVKRAEAAGCQAIVFGLRWVLLRSHRW